MNGSSGSICAGPSVGSAIASRTRAFSRRSCTKRSTLSGSRHDCSTSTGTTPASAVYAIITQLAAMAVVRNRTIVFMKNVRNMSSDPTYPIGSNQAQCTGAMVRSAGVARLLYRDSQGHEGTVELSPAEVVFVGRGLECAIRSDDGMVSRRHSQVKMENGRFVVEDLNSANGVFVNNVRVQKTELGHSDIVQCGSLMIRFIDESPPPAPPPKLGGTMVLEAAERPSSPRRSLPFGGPPAMPDAPAAPAVSTSLAPSLPFGGPPPMPGDAVLATPAPPARPASGVPVARPSSAPGRADSAVTPRGESSEPSEPRGRSRTLPPPRAKESIKSPAPKSPAPVEAAKPPASGLGRSSPSCATSSTRSRSATSARPPSTSARGRTSRRSAIASRSSRTSSPAATNGCAPRPSSPRRCATSSTRCAAS